MSTVFEAIRILAGDGASLSFCRHGGHLLSWQPPGAEEQLFLSSAAEFDESKAIRGGVPVIFPQFAGLGDLPKHGFARWQAWQILAQGQTHEGAAYAELGLQTDVETRGLWPATFQLKVRFEAQGQALAISLSVRNAGDTDLHFTAALHSYLRVAGIDATTLAGLERVPYLDATADRAMSPENQVEHADLLRFGPEIDRIYRTPGPLLLRDGVRALSIAAEGFTDTVVWNPGADKAAGLSDLGEGEWRAFVCVEAAVVSAPIRLAPGERWHGVQRFSLSGGL